MEIKIKKASSRELKSIAKLYADIYNEYLPNQSWSYVSSEEYIRFNYKKCKNLFYVAYADNKLVGFAFGYVKPWGNGNYLMLEEVVIDKSYNNFEIQIVLLKNILVTAKEKYNAMFVMGSTYEDKNGMPYNWYRDLGFKKDEDYFNVIGDLNTVIDNVNNL